MAAPVIHFEIHASDPQRALAFYREVFGWRDNAVPGMEQQYWLLYPNAKTPPQGQQYDGPGIAGGMLLRRGDPPRDGAAVNAFVCILSVEDLDEAHGKVKEHGGTIALPPMDIGGVGRIFYANDTEGNIIGVLEPM